MMLPTLTQFFHMGGYAFYVWSSYTSVFLFLLIQWFLPWQRWRTYVRQQITTSNHE